MKKKVLIYSAHYSTLHFKELFVYLWKNIKIWPFWMFFSYFWPLMTFFGLETNFLKIHVKSFILIYNLPSFEKDWNSTIFAIFDLGWPRITLRPFVKNLAQGLHFVVEFAFFWRRLKFDLFSQLLTSGDLRRPQMSLRLTCQKLTSRASFLGIISLLL